MTIIDRKFLIDRDETPQVGEYAETAIAGTEQTIVTTGTVDHNFSFSGSVHATTGGEDQRIEGVVALNRNIDVFDDGTDVLTIYVSSGGRAYIKRSAGTDTFDVALNYQYT